ncbi:MAG TPA: autotransporter outer membrane beta-barrel domain-containing protein, partial [Stellaceae bacterium]|nr:autotransporter outer membrane beta-barrel domain-containing protein [Stellaceae bacterium]
NTVIEVSPTAAAQLNITGTVSVAGGLKLVYDPGTYSNKSYGAIVHAGTLTGTYANTTSINLPANATQTLTYTSTDLDLALSGLTVSTTTGAFGDAADIALSGGFFDVDGMVFDHIDETQFGQGADQVKTALAGTTPMQLAMNGPLQQLAQAGSQMSDTLARHGAWVRGVGNFLDVDNHGAASGFSASGGGVLAGIDHPFGPVTLGIAGGYSGTNFKQNDGESGDIQTIRGMVYAHYVAAPQILIDGVAGIGYDRIHTSRPITSLGSNAAETHNAWEENLALQAGYVMPWQGFSIIPRIGAQYLHLAENRFSESGGSGFDLSRGHQSVDSFQPLISLAALRPFALANGMRVTPEFKLTYSHELLNPSETLALTTPAGSIVPANAVTPAHNTVTLGPSATLRLNESLNLFADYKLAIGVGRSLDHVIAAGARFTW